MHNWDIFQLADNCAVNKRIAYVIEMPYVGCNNHKLNLEVGRIISADTQMQTTIDVIHYIMSFLQDRDLPPVLIINRNGLAYITCLRTTTLFEIL